ncbi:hypothetical protein D9758_009247 [Tetrapyrgos nigripes]|uniref:Gag protein n=1 Tax=Tetrapyrgos nigripes TaxID=182062 RepID=A0A8H5FX38_9AGAR|nr:hypothetical protein D9758_009247 [Tetrapyrgos nigripes]
MSNRSFHWLPAFGAELSELENLCLRYYETEVMGHIVELCPSLSSLSRASSTRMPGSEIDSTEIPGSSPPQLAPLSLPPSLPSSFPSSQIPSVPLSPSFLSSIMSTPSADTTRPSVSIIALNTSLFKHEHLSKDKNNFPSWKYQFIQTLRMNQGADGYLDGSIIKPDKETEPRAWSNWKANNGSILGFMGLSVEVAEQEAIAKAETAQIAWTSLLKRHGQEGPVKQVQLIQEALSIRYSPSENFATISSKLTTLNDRIWEMGSLTPEAFLCILMINAMSNVPELRATREHVAQSFAQSDGTNPDFKDNPNAKKYDSSDIKRALDMAQGLNDSDSRTGDIALSSQTSPKSNLKNRPKCTNPKCPRQLGHTKEWCVSPGGGMAGKSITESREARMKAREKKENSTSGETKKPAYHVIESNGQAYIINMDNNTVIRATPSGSTPEFAGIACDSIHSIDPSMITEPERAEYEGWLAFEDWTGARGGET